MQRTILFLTLSCLAIGCGDGSSPIDRAAAAETSDAQDSGGKNESADYWEKLVMHPFHDAQGAVVVEMPFPATWQVMRSPKLGEPRVVGPNGIKIIDIPGQNFMYTSDPQMQRIYFQSGQLLRAMPGVEQLVQEDFVPWCASQGLEFVRQYEIPEVSRIDKWYNDQLYKAVPSQMEVMAIGTDWKHKNGASYFLLIHLVVGSGGNQQTWYYTSTGLQAKEAHFEAARKQLIFGLANARYHPEPIMAYNQSEAEKSGRSWAAHNQRMAANQAAFEASQRAFINRSTAINDSIMSGWRERNAASDKAQEQFIDTITERSNVIDPSTGQRYKVASGANQYWMNRNGEYIGVDSPDYNPNFDRLMDQENWEKLKKID